MAAVGVDVGGTKLLALAVDPGGRVVAEAERATPRSDTELLAGVVEAARAVGADESGAVGVGVPGLADTEGTLRFAPNLRGAEGAAIGRHLGEAFAGYRLWVGNDATAACWAEHRRGAGYGHDDILMATLGTGIGGGVVAGGRLVEGANRFAGEFGHMVVDPHGPQCPCGRRGCWERFASGAGLGLLGRELAVAGGAAEVARLAGDPEAVKGEHVTAAASAGDPAAIEIMARFAEWVAIGLANLANLFDPELIVLGGGLVRAGAVLMEPTRRIFAELVEAAGVRPAVQIVAAKLGPAAGAVGAALLAAGM